MGRNHEVTTVHPLLGKDGELTEPGWSRGLLQTYDRSMIRAPKWRIKEWDYYLVLSDGFAGAFTISDDGYIIGRQILTADAVAVLDALGVLYGREVPGPQ